MRPVPASMRLPSGGQRSKAAVTAVSAESPVGCGSAQATSKQSAAGTVDRYVMGATSRLGIFEGAAQR